MVLEFIIKVIQLLECSIFSSREYITRGIIWEKVKIDLISMVERNTIYCSSVYSNNVISISYYYIQIYWCTHYIHPKQWSKYSFFSMSWNISAYLFISQHSNVKNIRSARFICDEILHVFAMVDDSHILNFIWNFKGCIP